MVGRTDGRTDGMLDGWMVGRTSSAQADGDDEAAELAEDSMRMEVKVRSFCVNVHIV